MLPAAAASAREAALATFRRKKQVFEKRAPESGGAPSSDNGCRFASQYKAGPTDLAGRPWRG